MLIALLFGVAVLAGLWSVMPSEVQKSGGNMLAVLSGVSVAAAVYLLHGG